MKQRSITGSLSFVSLKISVLPSKELNAEECDARDDDSSIEAGYQILIHFLYLCGMTIEKLNDMRSRIAGIRRFL